MIDLTPLDVRKKKGDFRRILRGYDPVEVDTFLDLVEARLQALVLENLSLTEKVTRLETSLKALEQREKAVQEALVSAQKLREELADQSRREVDLLRRETEGEVERMRTEARSEIDRMRRGAELEGERRILEMEGMIRDRQRSLEEIERNRRKFLKALRTLLEREMDAVEVEEQRLPLEEAPIELELRGWRPPSELWLQSPASEVRTDSREGSPESGVGEEAGQGRSSASKPAAPGAGAPSDPGEGEAVGDPEEAAGGEEVRDDLPSEEDGEEEGGAESSPWRILAGEPLDEGAQEGEAVAPSSPEEEGPAPVPEGGSPGDSPTPPSPSREEPLWLSTLLKREGLDRDRSGE